MNLPKNDWSQPDNDQSLMTLPENYRSQLGSNRSLPENQPLPDMSSPCCPTQEEETDEILPTLETSSAPVPHQSLVEDVIQITSCPKIDNTNKISHDNLISEGTKPTYQLLERKNHGKPRVQYEADLKAKGKYLINNYISLSRLSESRVHYVKQLADISVPNNVTEALKDPKWKEAMNEEMQALQKNVRWELVPLPNGKKTVGYRWIYTVKLKADGSVEIYKARLVAKEYTQRYEIDYKETFAPIAKINTIRVLLSLAANLDWPLHQFDSNADHTLFLKRDGRRLTALIVYVDDIVVTGNDKGEQLKLQKYLSQEFEMKDLGILGCKPADIPIKMNHNLCEDMDQEPTNKEQYQRLVERDIEVVGYIDADWAGSVTDRRSTSDYFTFVGGNLVTWRSNKQNVVSRSSAEAEYRGMAYGVCELLWIRRLLT
ncbi:uncharacterized protein LOC109949244 [Prunus persica]|uniref:uncharacterized protein LOC109949244 n=1 Tax=Prunus persica TaxID=3760 RepID=UPI0009AB54EC|nr:uncharacterized protein LOC109949244 [Prunus persica]